MENRQARQAAALNRTALYLDSVRIDPMPPLLLETRTRLQDCIDRLQILRQQQHSAGLAVDGPRPRDASRTLRREKMMPLVRIARPLLKFAPGVERVMRVPHARSDAMTVATAARDMAKLLKPHQKLLKSAGLPSDFLAELRRDADTLAESVKRSEKVRRVRSAATAAIARELKEARKHVTVIEGILMFHLKDTTKLSVFKSERRVGARIGRPRRKKSLPTPPVS